MSGLVRLSRELGSLFHGIGKYISLYSDKATYTFPPLVSEEKLARRVPNVAFSMWSVWHEGRIRPTIVSCIEIPRCFVGPTFVPQSGPLASLQKKDERQRPRVFLNVNITHDYAYF
jgi:hypothetical protein